MGEFDTQYKKSTISLVIAALFLLTSGTASALYLLDRPDSRIKVQQVQTATAEATETKEPDSTKISYTAVAGKTVLEQLQSQHDVVVADSQYGPYVDSINDIKGGADGKYWSYYVNGQLASTGAGANITTGGEKITWKFE